MLIPLFGSCPTFLNREQDAARRLILGEINQLGLEWRSLGRTDFPTRTPLKEGLARTIAWFRNENAHAGARRPA